MSDLGSDPQQPQPMVEAPAQPAPAPDPVHGGRAAAPGALLCVGAAALTVLGSLQDLFTARMGFGRGDQRLVITGWELRLEGGDESDAGIGSIINGAPLMIAVAVLLAAAVLAMFTVTRPSAARFGRAGGLAAVIAATFLAATVCTIGVQELFWLDAFQPGSDPQDAGEVRVGPGFWTLVGAAALGMVAAVVVWRRVRSDPERVEPDTPVLGIPRMDAMVRRLPDAPPDQPER